MYTRPGRMNSNPMLTPVRMYPFGVSKLAMIMALLMTFELGIVPLTTVEEVALVDDTVQLTELFFTVPRSSGRGRYPTMRSTLMMEPLSANVTGRKVVNGVVHPFAVIAAPFVAGREYTVVTAVGVSKTVAVEVYEDANCLFISSYSSSPLDLFGLRNLWNWKATTVSMEMPPPAAKTRKAFGS
ncbi:hypothetical protein EDD37DRAFT_620588 [Exophiala viscosa]|uniref:uncharacterized protein n=1 Tax=Exophiala viscosa TaxID=2486360 RepID=UPI00219D43EF|nr:hypothetical protein EDD37DRAFT_620588 [Exophiala viscosa]